MPPIGITQPTLEQFSVFEPGVYFITYGVHYSATTVTLPASTAITVNGIISDAFAVKSGNEIDGWNVSSGIIILNSGDVVRVIHSGSDIIGIGNGLPGAEAYLNFLRIA